MRKQNYIFYYCLFVSLLIFPVLANFDLAEKAYQRGVYNFAVINYERVLIEERDPVKRETARYRLVDSHYQTGKWNDAEKNAQKYFEDYPSGRWLFEVKYTLALTWIKKKNYSEARLTIDSLIDNYPQHPEIHKLFFTLAQIYQSTGRYIEAIGVLERSLPGYEADRGFLRARIHYLNQSYQVALGEVAKLNKNQIKVFSLEEVVDLEVEILLKLEKYNEAQEVMKEYFYRLQDKEIKSKFLFYQSHIFYLQGDYTKAIVNYKNYLNKEKTSVYRNDVIFFLALAYYQVEQPIIALEYISMLEETKRSQDKELSTEDRARRDKLAYLIYKKLDQQEKQSDYLDKLFYSGSPEELFAVKEKVKRLALENDQDLSKKKVSQQMEGYLNRYEGLEKSSIERADFYNQIAEIYFNNKNSPLNVFFSRLAYSHSSDSTYLLGLADRLSALKEYDRAVDIYQSLLKGSVGEERQYIQDVLGYALFQTDQYQRSVQSYQENLDATNSKYQASAWFYSGENHRLLQNYVESEKYFNGFLEKFPDDERVALANLNLGFIYYYGNKDYRKALKSLDKAYQAHESLSESSDEIKKNKIGGSSFLSHIFQLRFRCYLDLGEEKNAIEQLRLISRRDHPDLYYSNLLILAKFYFNLEDYSRSLNQYYEIINSESSDASPNDSILEKAYFERILIKLKKNSGREAYFYLLKLQDRFPESILVREAFLSIGDYYYSRKRWVSTETVYSAFEKYAKTPEDRIYALYYLGFTRQQMGKNEEAYLNFRTIKDIGKSEKIFNDFYFDALFELGIYEFDNKRLSEAKINFQEIIDRSPNTSLKQKTLANFNIIESMDNPNPYAGAETVDEIKKKIENVTAPVLKDQGYYMIAKIYYDSGSYNLAYEAAKKLDPPSVYFGDAMILSLKSLIALNQFNEAYAYGMESFFSPDLNISRDKREYLYYILTYTSNKLGRRSDYKKFLKLLRDEFPNTKYLER